MTGQKAGLSETVLVFIACTCATSRAPNFSAAVPVRLEIPTRAQALFSISLFTDAAQMALENDKIEVAKSNLGELTALSRAGRKDWRQVLDRIGSWPGHKCKH